MDDNKKHKLIVNASEIPFSYPIYKVIVIAQSAENGMILKQDVRTFTDGDLKEKRRKAEDLFQICANHMDHYSPDSLSSFDPEKGTGINYELVLSEPDLNGKHTSDTVLDSTFKLNENYRNLLRKEAEGIIKKWEDAEEADAKAKE